MKLDAVRMAILLTWPLGIAAIAIGYLLTPFAGCVFGLVVIGLFRSPHINDTKTVSIYAREQKALTFGLLGIAAGVAIWLFVESMRLDHIYTSITDGFADHYYWVPFMPLVLFLLLHDVWLFRRGGISANE